MGLDHEHQPILKNPELRATQWAQTDPKQQVADNILSNAQMVATDGGLTPKDFLDITQNFTLSIHATAESHPSARRQPIGKLAIQESFSISIGNAAALAGWDMDSPEVVYMSSFLLLWSVGATLRRRTEHLGSVQFAPETSEEKQQTVIATRRGQIEHLKHLYNSYSSALDKYTAMMPTPDDISAEEYREILRGILFLDKPYKYTHEDTDLQFGPAAAKSNKKKLERTVLIKAITTENYQEALRLVREDQKQKFPQE